jgi:tetratricopeptide (TPR) repeat protein
MSEPELKDTQPNRVVKSMEPVSPVPDEKKKFPRWLVGLCIVALVAIGLMAGYGSGMGQRYAAQNVMDTGLLEEQFQLGQQAFAAGNYELAKQYFDFIMSKNSNFPGIQAAYVDLRLHMQVTPTPLFSPTPLVSPTPDMRAGEEIFSTAQQLLNSSDWNGAITNLDSLRKAFPSYRTAEVDGMYYMALHQRGVGKIAAACPDVNLEGGIYDLTLAEHFVGAGNLDSYAESLRTYARLYIIGASFWDQDWVQAQNFFSQVMAAYPNMVDSSCTSATKRWYDATIKRAEQMMAAGDACGAGEQYAAAFMVSDPFNNTAYPTATEVSNKCNGTGGEDTTPTISVTPTTGATPTETTTPLPPTPETPPATAKP